MANEFNLDDFLAALAAAGAEVVDVQEPEIAGHVDYDVTIRARYRFPFEEGTDAETESEEALAASCAQALSEYLAEGIEEYLMRTSRISVAPVTATATREIYAEEAAE